MKQLQLLILLLSLSIYSSAQKTHISNIATIELPTKWKKISNEWLEMAKELTDDQTVDGGFYHISNEEFPMRPPYAIYNLNNHKDYFKGKEKRAALSEIAEQFSGVSAVGPSRDVDFLGTTFRLDVLDSVTPYIDETLGLVLIKTTIKVDREMSLNNVLVLVPHIDGVIQFMFILQDNDGLNSELSMNKMLSSLRLVSKWD